MLNNYSKKIILSNEIKNNSYKNNYKFFNNKNE